MQTRLALAAAALAIALARGAAAETVTLDLATYTVPDGWTVESAPRSNTRYTQVDQANKRYCVLTTYISTKSTGTLDADARADWDMVVKGWAKVGKPKARKVPAIAGWQGRGASATYVDTNGFPSTVILHTYSNGSLRLSFVAVSNQMAAYKRPVEAYFASIRLPAGEAPAPGPTVGTPPAPLAPPPAASAGARTTNFVEGFVGVEEAAWVKVTSTKAPITARIHHTTFDLTPYVNQDGTVHVWNQLIVPRYAHLTNVWVRAPWWEDGGWNGKPELIAADARDGSGTPVYVVLYRGVGQARWVEIVTPDRATFERQLTVVQREGGTNWAPLDQLGGFNKFAVTLADIAGTWTSSSGAGVQYVNAYTGTSAGMGYASSTETFEFAGNGTFHSKWVGASNAGGSSRTVFGGEEYRGAVSVKDWQVTLTNRFKGRTDVFDAWFEAVKGGRVLHLLRDGTDTVLVKIR